MSRNTTDTEPSADTEGGAAAAPPPAWRRVTRWPGWIWAVPAAALMFVVWLALRSWLFAAEDVTVHFADAAGVSPGTPVRYKGVDVGSVESIRPRSERAEVAMRLRIDAPIAERLGETTKFWIEQPSLSEGVTTLLAGTYLAVRPGGSEARDTFTALRKPPLARAGAGQRRFVLTASAASGLKRGAPVLFRGLRVGRVAGVRYREDAVGVEVYGIVERAYKDRVRRNSVFWQAGGLSLSQGAGGLKVDLPSVATLAGGALAFSTPSVFAGAQAGPDAVFRLHRSRAAAMAAPGGTRLAYTARLPGLAGDLGRGAPVTLEEKPVGWVSRVRLAVDAETGAFTSPVRFVLDAERLGLTVDSGMPRKALRDRLNTRLAGLVERGLRARRGSGGPVLGGSRLELVRLDEADSARLKTATAPPAIPAAAPAGGFKGALASLERTAGRLEALPIDQLVENLVSASRRIAAVTDSPQIRESLQSLKTTLDNLESITASAEREIPPLLTSLNRTAEAAQAAADAVDRLAGGSVGGNRDLQDMVAELTEAARAISALARYLERHPEAVLQGREEK